MTIKALFWVVTEAFLEKRIKELCRALIEAKLCSVFRTTVLQRNTVLELCRVHSTLQQKILRSTLISFRIEGTLSRVNPIIKHYSTLRE